MRTTKLIFAAAVAAAASPAFAGDKVVINATINNSCTLDTGSGTLTVSQDNVKNSTPVQGALSVWCTQGHLAKINATSAKGYKLVTTTGEEIAYTLWRDSLTSQGFTDVSFTGGVDAAPSTVNYWVKPAATNPKAGTYEDTLTFTIAP